MNADAQAERPANVIGAFGAIVERFNDTTERLLATMEQSSVDVGERPERLGGETQLRELRAAMPRRIMMLSEGLVIAERQASLLRWQLGGAGSAALPTEQLDSLGFLSVIRRPGIAASALAARTDHGWVIVLRSDEPQVRQRFSLAHEIKHAIDDELVSRNPGGLYQTIASSPSGELAERVCDFFAGCLLMPKMLLRRDWTDGIQDPVELARRYDVSKAAMEVRLRQTGLTEPLARCGPVTSPRLDLWARQSNDRRTTNTTRTA